MSPMYEMSDELLSTTQKVEKFEAHCFVKKLNNRDHNSNLIT